jgi:hypothetical protein
VTKALIRALPASMRARLRWQFDGGDLLVAEGRGDVLEAGFDHGAWAAV